MTADLTASLIKDLLVFLKGNKDFFANPNHAQAMNALGAESFVSYLSGTTAEKFIDDLQFTVKALKGDPKAKKADSAIIKALADYFLKDFANPFDRLDKSYQTMSFDEQTETLAKIFPVKSNFFSTLRTYIFKFSPQEMTDLVVSFLIDLLESPRIVVQSPIEADQKTKASVREYFSRTHPKSFVAFSINSQLIGGIRFIVDGKVEDMSWFSKIQNFHKLYTN